MNKNPGKKSVYVDVDEEITSIIDKVKSAKESIIALVLPKRATMLQSIVNMKLLKRAADQDDKKVVLITTESTLLPLAGLAGLHVAPNLQSRPYLPPPPDGAGGAIPGDPAPSEEDIVIDPKTPVGELVDPKGAADEQPIEIDNTLKTDESAGAGAAPSGKKGKGAKGKGKLKVPSFNKFRKKFIIAGAAAVFLLFFLLWAIIVAPKATVTIKGDTSDVPLSLEFTADTDAEKLDMESAVIPAKKVELKKSDSEKVPATGQKDKGTKAGGTVTLKNCSDNDVNIPAGTGISSGEFTFIIQQGVSMNAGNFDSGGNCKNSGSHTESANAIAQNNGDQYNLSPRSYTVAGYSKVTAQGGQMSGGTSNVVKVISAGDVESAKQKLNSDQSASKEELKKQLEDDGYMSVNETFAENQPRYTPSPAVGSEANEVTVAFEVTYTMLGVKKDDLKKLVEKEAKKQIDTSKQAILSDGLGNAIFQVGEKAEATTQLTLQTKVIAGPEVDQNAIKSDIRGKKRGEAEQLLGSRSGYKEVKVDTSPFWNYSVPKKASKITIKVEQANGATIAP